MIDRASHLYAKKEIELSCLIRQGTISNEYRQNNDMTNCTSANYVEIRTKLS